MTRFVRPACAVLNNGLRAWTFSLPALGRAHVGVTLRSGPVYEDDDTWGMSHVLEHMVFRGTRHWPTSQAISLRADDLGGEVGGSTFRDRALYDLRCDTKNVEPALELLRDMVTSPRMQGLRVERDIIREELLDAYDERGQHIDADNVVYGDLFGAEPLARSIDGSLEGLEAVTVAALRRFFRQQYSPERAAVVVVGPRSVQTMQRQIRRAFGAWDKASSAPVGRGPQKKPRPGQGVRVVRTEQSQTHLRMCFRLASHDLTARTEAAVLCRVLDDGPASRLQTRLVDNEGLCYSLWAHFDSYEHDGVIEIGAQVAHDRVVPLVKALVRELSMLKNKAPGRDELARVARRWERDMIDAYESPGRLVESSSRRALMDLPWDPAGSLRRLRALKRPGLTAKAKSTFCPGPRMATVLVGQPQGVGEVRTLLQRLAR